MILIFLNLSKHTFLFNIISDLQHPIDNLYRYTVLSSIISGLECPIGAFFINEL